MIDIIIVHAVNNTLGEEKKSQPNHVTNYKNYNNNNDTPSI